MNTGRGFLEEKKGLERGLFKRTRRRKDLKEGLLRRRRRKIRKIKIIKRKGDLYRSSFI